MEELWKIVSALSAVSVFTYYLFSRWNKGKNYPPGPRRLPFVGNLLSMEPNPALFFLKLVKKYGSIISVRLGAREWVVLNDFDSIREAYLKQGDKFSGRPRMFITYQMSKGHGIILLDHGEKWKIQRKFGIRTLRGFGLGKTAMEEKIHDEAAHLVKAIEVQGDKPFNVQSVLTNAVSNIICAIVMGSRFSYDDKRFVNIVNRLSRSFSDKVDATLLAVMTLVPTLRFLPIFSGAYRRQFEDYDAILATIREIIDEHRATYDKNDIRDFIDAFLQEMENAGENSTFTNLQMFYYVRDLFIAGTDTTSNSLRWCILFLLHRPDCQEKIASEIEATIGDDYPRMRHRPDMPYTCAFIQEVMRHRPLLPLMAPHQTTGNVNLKGYEIPKGTSIMGNMWAVHHDPVYFKNPKEFRPERFIDDSGRFVPCDHVIPFGLGPRYCLGDQLVNMEIFIFLTSIVKRFHIRPDPKRKPPSFHKGVQGFTYVALQFKTLFMPRD